MKDLDTRVKLSAISSASKVDQPELLPYLIDGLSSPFSAMPLLSSLIELGNSSLDRLDHAFYKIGLDTQH